MRDILVTMLVFCSLPMIFRQPFFGVVVWTWLSLMNPHRLAWGFSTTMPFAEIVAICLFTSYLMSKEPKQIPWSREVIVLAVFIAWMFLTTVNAMWPALAWPQWDKVWRIQLVILVTLMLTTSRPRIETLMWVIAVSLGFYGFKGGIWVLMTGGAQRVYGPSHTFIGGNNELGLALIMTVPVIWYLIMRKQRRWLQMGLYACLAFTLIAIIGTHSRGALVGVAAMGVVFLLKSRRRVLPLILGGIFIAMVPHIVPENWFERMNTIETYEEDKSATERIRAWHNAMDLASKRVLGGGYDVLIRYGGRDAHSIYFEVLGEHGYIGLALFLSLGILTWRKAGTIKKLTKQREDLRWAGDLAAMIQVSMIGYASAGAFLGLAYFDLYYVLIALIVCTHRVVEKELATTATVNVPDGRAPRGGRVVAADTARAPA